MWGEEEVRGDTRTRTTWRVPSVTSSTLSFLAATTGTATLQSGSAVTVTGETVSRCGQVNIV